jgi:hypothetical protein
LILIVLLNIRPINFFAIDSGGDVAAWVLGAGSCKGSQKYRDTQPAALPKI